MSDRSKLAKSTQEQSVAAWVNHLNQIRLDGLLQAFRQQDLNLQNALASIDEAIKKIDLEVVVANRGGLKGMHGFIAEVAEVGVGNARTQILGEGAFYQWANDNGDVDLLRGGIEIQQKFFAGGVRFDLGAVAEHLEKYPDFVARGGRYQIPRDHFEVITYLYDLPREEAGKLLTRSGDGRSFKDWERVQSFFSGSPIGIESLEASNHEYRDVQRGAYMSTLESERDALRSTDKGQRDSAYVASRPTLKEGAKATAVAAAAEGGTAFVLAVVAKRRKGKQFKDFTSADWTDVAKETGFGGVRGGVRGLSIYSLSNFTATSAAVASSIVTAAFGIAEQANRLRRGEIGEAQFIEAAELVSLEAAVSGLSSFVGQALIPVPVLGAVIGNTIGMVMYNAVSSSLSRREAELIERYVEEQRILDERLEANYRSLIDKLGVSMSDYLDVLERAFSPNVEVALLGSVELALDLGVGNEDVLDTEAKIRAFFID